MLIYVSLEYTRDFLLKRQQKSLLPKGTYKRDALNPKFLNIKPRLVLSIAKDLQRLKNTLTRISFVGILILYFLGYYPTFNFPPIARSEARAVEQRYEVIAEAFKQPINLPHPGYLSSKYSSYHPGVDIATGLGMPIHPISDGVVTAVNFGFWGYGNHVVVTHSDGFQSLYGHMGRIFVKKDQPITTSNYLGEVGLTGRTSGPHTHLEITHDGKYIDPLTILPEIRDYPIAKDFAKASGGKELSKALKPDF